VDLLAGGREGGPALVVLVRWEIDSAMRHGGPR
jgi:hypothetical protein